MSWRLSPHSLASMADPVSNLVKEMIQVAAAGHSMLGLTFQHASTGPRLGPAYRAQLGSAFLSSGPCSQPLGGLSLSPPPSFWNRMLMACCPFQAVLAKGPLEKGLRDISGHFRLERTSAGRLERRLGSDQSYQVGTHILYLLRAASSPH